MTPVYTQFEIIPTGMEWLIRRDGREFLALQTKQVAIDEVAAQVERIESCHVVVKALDGSVEEERTFGAVQQVPPTFGRRHQA